MTPPPVLVLLCPGGGPMTGPVPPPVLVLLCPGGVLMTGPVPPPVLVLLCPGGGTYDRPGTSSSIGIIMPRWCKLILE